MFAEAIKAFMVLCFVLGFVLALGFILFFSKQPEPVEECYPAPAPPEAPAKAIDITTLKVITL